METYLLEINIFKNVCIPFVLSLSLQVNSKTAYLILLMRICCKILSQRINCISKTKLLCLRVSSLHLRKREQLHIGQACFFRVETTESN